MNYRRIIPNLCTASNLFFGMCSMLATLHHDFFWGSVFILLALVADGLDGRTALCSRFLDSLLDAHPHMVVVQSAGNEGKNKWRHISFPGDVAEAVTVGAADSEGTGRSGKSGTGYYPHPVKPDLVVYDSPNGTSFSTPVVTGLCAALMGYRPMKRRELIRLLHASGTRSAAPDLETGYGIPQCDTLLGFLDTPAELQTLPLNATQ